MVVRTGRGTYTRLAKPAPVADPRRLPSASRRLRKTLEAEGMEFALSCLDVLAGYTDIALRRFPHFSWVASGSEDRAAEAAERAGFSPVREPKQAQLALALALAADRNPLILRKTSIFYAAGDGLASVERALVDLHYEVTRERYPLDGAELLCVFYDVLTSVSADFPKMLRYAGLRRLRHEINWILGHNWGSGSISLKHTSTHPSGPPGSSSASRPSTRPGADEQDTRPSTIAHAPRGDGFGRRRQRSLGPGVARPQLQVRRARPVQPIAATAASGCRETFPERQEAARWPGMCIRTRATVCAPGLRP